MSIKGIEDRKVSIYVGLIVLLFLGTVTEEIYSGNKENSVWVNKMTSYYGHEPDVEQEVFRAHLFLYDE